MIKTLKVRIKDKHAPILNEMARSVNFVFNYVNDLSSRIIKEKYRFPNYYELEKYTAKSGKLLNLHSQTVQWKESSLWHSEPIRNNVLKQSMQK